MTKRILFCGFLIFISAVFFSGPARALENTFSGNYIIPEDQVGFENEKYEALVAQKCGRGLENFLLPFLEVPHGVKTEIEEHRAEYLPMTFESFFIGAFHGFLRGVGRMGVGLYEIVTCPYPQKPILEDMNEWLY